MSLTAELQALYQARQEKMPADVREVMARATRALADSGQAGRVPSAGDQAPTFALPDATGRTVSLTERLATGPVVLTFYRGGWCPYCNLALAYLQRFLPQFTEAGARLIAISPEKPDESLTTKEKHDLDFEVLTDEENAVARLYGGVHRLGQESKSFYRNHGIPDYYNGELQEFPVPATYIISQEGTVIYAFVESDYRQRAEPSFIVGIIKQYQKGQHGEP